MPTQSVVFAAAPELILQQYWKIPGQFTFVVPALSKYVRAHALGCGGQGQAWGGGAALARSTRLVTPGETLKIQVGNTSTASTPGDSWVKFNNDTIICYADRGRGNSTQGLASNSIGDVTKSGFPGGSPNGGAPASDATDAWPVFGPGQGAKSSLNPGQAATPGGGGLNVLQYAETDGSIQYYWPYGAGMGRVCLQFFTAEPGLGL